MKDRILLIKNATGTITVGPFSIDEAKNAQDLIIKKLSKGQQSVIIGKIKTLDEFLNSLDN
ncbi:MAG: hypothetical protein NTX85_02675 [Candidatus Nomurabacteria bacterium]|nr:hypothetical protein [Candidatus Nomurabacteria bacterium]